MTVDELTELLNKVLTRKAEVYVDDTIIGKDITRVIVQHDMENDSVYVVLKTRNCD